tara:strand:- start:19343 stop:20539 length:1197 start_codon:yes stop_codon:yes gene_type:complete
MAEENELGWKLRPLDDDGKPIEKEETAQEETQTTEVEATTEQGTQEEVEPATTETGTAEPEDTTEEPTVEVSSEDVEPEPKAQGKEIDEQAVLQYLKDRHQKEYNSIDEVLTNNEEKTQSQELSEDIQTYLKFKQETGRSMQDFIMAQRDVSSLDDSAALYEYYRETKPHLSPDDINYLITESFGYDEEVDEEKDVRRKKIAYKDEVYKAKKHLEDLANKYKVPLESSGKPLDANTQEALEFYSKYKQESRESEEQSKNLQDVFRAKTDNLFNEEFKGFEFNVGKKKLLFKLSSPNEVKQSQSDINKMLSRYTDKDTGALRDAYEFHKSAFAMTNPDLIAKLAYEQGLSDATNNIVKETKNIDMTVRENQVTEKSGLKYRVLDSDGDFSGGLKFKKRS